MKDEKVTPKQILEAARQAVQTWNWSRIPNGPARRAELEAWDEVWVAGFAGPDGLVNLNGYSNVADFLGKQTEDI